ncbi:MAG: TonB-dependent receptor [Bacteroidota bacterium]|jgi:TonB-dependent receptor
MKAPLSVPLLVLTLFLLPVVAFGQATLTGVVTDSLTSEKLIGVNVVLVGTGMGSATNIEGEYKINNIPAKTYDVRVSCIGYEAKIVSVDFSKLTVRRLNFQLTATVIQGKEVIVTGQMRGQIAAMNRQVSSNTIVNVVSEEKIKELPDANAAEAIGRLPGVSILRSGGEATTVVLRGLSSKFSNITVDGVRVPATDSTSRDVDLSMISQGSLAGIELYKTLTPDQDADAIAGAVNLVTRKAPSERLLRFDIKGDYNRLMKSSKEYDLSGRYGERFFDDILGVQLQGNAERKIRSREDITYGYRTFKNSSLSGYDPSTTGLDNDYLINQFRVDFTDELRERNGGQVIFDVNTPDSGTVKVSALYSSTSRNISLYNRIYPAGAGGVNWDYNYRYTELGTSTLSVSSQGKNFLLGFEADWNISYANSKVTNPFDYQMAFTETPGVVIVNGESMPSGRDHPELNIIPWAANDYQAATLTTASRFRKENSELERSVALNLARKYTLTDLLSGELKMGGKYRNRTRWRDEAEYDDNSYLHGFFSNNLDGSKINLTGTRFEDYYLHRTIGSPSLSDFISQPAPTRDLMSLYRMNPLIDDNALRQWYDLNKNGVSGASLEYNPNDQALLNEYNVTERLSAGFLMNSLNIGQLMTLIAGVRVEQERNDYESKFAPGGLSTIGIVVSATAGIKDSTAAYTETIWLPNAQLIVRPTDFLSLRFAAYRALARPDYDLRLPRFLVVSGSPTPITLGNPSLRDTKAANYEVNAQVYSGTIGLISVSAFYKKIDDFYHEMSGVNISRGFDSLLTAIGVTWQNTEPFKSLINRTNNYTVTLPYNSDHPTYAWGFEFEHQINLGFLPSYFKNFTLSYNASLTRSETYIIQSVSKQDSVFQVNPRTGQGKWVPGTPYNAAVEVKRQSENQPKLFGNVALGYDIGGFSARISVFYQDEYIMQYSTDGQSDVHVNSFTKWDLALKQEIFKNFSLFLNVNNLTNSQEGTSRINVVRDWHLPRTAELYGTTVDFGVRLTM